jgi:hypothetical protein
MRLTAESGGSAAMSPVASPESIPSPNTRKRPRSESKQDGDVQRRCRKILSQAWQRFLSHRYGIDTR